MSLGLTYSRTSNTAPMRCVRKRVGTIRHVSYGYGNPLLAHVGSHPHFQQRLTLTPTETPALNALFHLLPVPHHRLLPRHVKIITQIVLTGLVALSVATVQPTPTICWATAHCPAANAMSGMFPPSRTGKCWHHPLPSPPLLSPPLHLSTPGLPFLTHLLPPAPHLPQLHSTAQTLLPPELQQGPQPPLTTWALSSVGQSVGWFWPSRLLCIGGAGAEPSMRGLLGTVSLHLLLYSPGPKSRMLQALRPQHQPEDPKRQPQVAAAAADSTPRSLSSIRCRRDRPHHPLRPLHRCPLR